ncbi:hypothetical protein MVEN_01623000 [Mycena venus]|uniref:Uncharacterized protein n=1 Tax=Mycena venus TaxID=2733690 RepID=A0A8H7CSN1_9AGAR|nr:hypothetical protein MVEN_01623000 [Mycena venus]
MKPHRRLTLYMCHCLVCYTKLTAEFKALKPYITSKSSTLPGATSASVLATPTRRPSSEGTGKCDHDQCECEEVPELICVLLRNWHFVVDHPLWAVISDCRQRVCIWQWCLSCEGGADVDGALRCRAAGVLAEERACAEETTWLHRVVRPWPMYFFTIQWNILFIFLCVLYCAI